MAVTKDTELEPLEGLDGSCANHRDVERGLTALGWTRCGEGDWAVALRSPSGRHAARISPFDPACEFQVEICRTHPVSRYFPRLDLHIDLEGGGCLQVMEFLHPVDEEAALALRRRLEEGDCVDPDLGRAAAAMARVHARAQRTLRWCGALDLNAGNFMRDQFGQVKVIDLFFMEGQELYGRVLTDPSEVLRLFPAAKRRYMFEIPYLIREATAEQIRDLRESLATAEARIKQSGGSPEGAA